MKQITFQEIIEKKETGTNHLLIDVREPFEHEEYNIGGLLIPLGEIISKASEIPTTIQVIMYCRKGIRSQIAIQRLEDKYGYHNLYNLQGGIEQFKQHPDMVKMTTKPT